MSIYGMRVRASNGPDIGPEHDVSAWWRLINWSLGGPYWSIGGRPNGPINPSHTGHPFKWPIGSVAALIDCSSDMGPPIVHTHTTCIYQLVFVYLPINLSLLSRIQLDLSFSIAFRFVCRTHTHTHTHTHLKGQHCTYYYVSWDRFSWWNIFSGSFGSQYATPINWKSLQMSYTCCSLTQCLFSVYSPNLLSVNLDRIGVWHTKRPQPKMWHLPSQSIKTLGRKVCVCVMSRLSEHSITFRLPLN